LKKGDVGGFLKKNFFNSKNLPCPSFSKRGFKQIAVKGIKEPI
jgi:hypothetical protein